MKKLVVMNVNEVEKVAAGEDFVFSAVDMSKEEIKAIEAEAARRGIRQKVLLRLTPGIDPHTYEAVATGKVDSKFGTAIETGQAKEMVAYTLSLPTIELEGFHCHVGSQVFGEDVYERTSDIMLEFIRECRDRFHVPLPVLDLGGGYGVRYVDRDGEVDIPAAISRVARHMQQVCARLDMTMPQVHMEPGRSIVADAGLTLYTVGTVKKITGYKNYVSVDGGMTDNPRYALYQSPYTVLPASRMGEERDFLCSLAGRCCESGDLVQENITLPQPRRGDLLAVLTTGAYNFSMASNYNRLCRPALVLVRGGQARLAVRRQTFQDLVACDL